MLFHMCLYFLKIIESWLVYTSCLVQCYGPAIVVHWQAKGSAMAGCSHGAWLFLLFFHVLRFGIRCAISAEVIKDAARSNHGAFAYEKLVSSQ